MLENWLKPVAAPLLAQAANLDSYQLGKNIALYSTADALPDLTNAQVALIGIDAKAADAMRQQLYRLSYPFADLRIIDLGNVRKNHSETIIPVLQELLQAHIIPVLLGGADGQLPYLQYRAYRQLSQLISAVFVSDRLGYSPENNWQTRPEYYLNRIVAQPDHYLFNTCTIAYQSHFANPKALDWHDIHHFEYLRLGKIKHTVEETEPLLRDADLVCIDIAALKQADAPACPLASPNGLAAEELCQIARYAGLSDKLSSFGIFHYDPARDRDTQTAQLIAQTIWYFLDGVAQRKHDYPLKAGNFNEYLVSLADSSHTLTFWKSIRSERWWLQVPVASSAQQARHRLFPCSYTDYVLATQGELSARILLAYRRFAVNW